MCNGDCKCSQEFVKCPDTDAPDMVKLYWNHAAILNGAEKMLASVRGNLAMKNLDADVVLQMGYVMSSLEWLINSTTVAIKRMKDNGKDW